MKNLQPVTHYTPPLLPMLAEKPSLCELPKRWARNAAVVACIGMLGATTLAGCMGAHNYADDTTTTTQYATEALPPYQTREPVHVNYSDLDIEVRLSHGGSGFAFYVVHLTEQEMHNILRAELSAAGLNFNDASPAYTVEWEFDDFPNGMRTLNLRLSWFNAEKNIGIIFGFGTQDVIDGFAEQHGIIAGIFHNPSSSFFWNDELGRYLHALVPPTDEEVAATVPRLVAHLRAQVDDFITHLQSEGIL
ncbi:MAG: hypothetical protein FWD06_02415 [Oscillospiraceae bacterium]|nr:hypothetical protein [Oscillospiraceae bacterium]